jgi:hypothetical protein
MFQEWGLDGYDPVDHWTSNLRERSGVVAPSNLSNADPDVSPFTFTDQRSSKGMTELLRSLGLMKDDYWMQLCPRYHIEVAVSRQEWDSPFLWSSLKFKRVSLQHMTFSPPGRSLRRGILN